MDKLKLPARVDHLESLLSFVELHAEKSGFPENRLKEIKLAAEEALVNIIHYAYGEREGDVEVACRMDDKDSFIIEIRDTGVPFDIRSVSEPDLTSDISERKIGGLGIFLIKKMVDTIKYRRDGERNILSLINRK
ncbi:MAG: ATP-binding protein [Pseudomonadota bacterium]